MRSNTSNSTKNQTAPAASQSRGDSVNQVTLIGRLVAAPEMREAASGKRVTTVRVATNGKSHAEVHDVVSGVSSLTSPRVTSARDASSTARVGSRAASGSPPTAALGAPSRPSPIGSRRSPPRVLRRLRGRDRQGSFPKGFSPGPLGDGKPDPSTCFWGSVLSRLHGAARRQGAASRRFASVLARIFVPFP
jgi:hypothetical protein